MTPWNDTNRYNQTGYSAPTIFPDIRNYTDKDLWVEDYCKALKRNESHLEWVWEEQYEAREEAYIQAQETKALREEYYDYT